MNKFIRFFVPIVIAVVFGPLIVGLVVGLYAVFGSIADRTVTMSDIVGLIGVSIMFAYLIGYIIAAIAGILVSIWMIWRQPNVLVAIGATVIATSAYMGLEALGFLGPAGSTNAWDNYLFTLTLAIIAAIGCWLLTRRFVRAI